MTAKVRVAVAGLSLSAVALVGLVTSENYTDTAIIPTKGDKPTYGFGMTQRPDGSPVRMGDRTNPVQALQRSLAYIQRDEAKLRQCVKVPLHQAEYDVYVDVAYNIGIAGFCGSSIVKRANAGDYRGACEAILMWRNVGRQDCSVPGNRVCWGLWQRRLQARDACVAAGS